MKIKDKITFVQNIDIPLKFKYQISNNPEDYLIIEIISVVRSIMGDDLIFYRHYNDLINENAFRSFKDFISIYGDCEIITEEKFK